MSALYSVYLMNDRQGRTVFYVKWNTELDVPGENKSFLKIYFILVYLIYSVVLISAV